MRRNVRKSKINYFKYITSGIINMLIFKLHSYAEFTDFIQGNEFYYLIRYKISLKKKLLT